MKNGPTRIVAILLGLSLTEITESAGAFRALPRPLLGPPAFLTVEALAGRGAYSVNVRRQGTISLRANNLLRRFERNAVKLRKSIFYHSPEELTRSFHNVLTYAYGPIQYG